MQRKSTLLLMTTTANDKQSFVSFSSPVTAPTPGRWECSSKYKPGPGDMDGETLREYNSGQNHLTLDPVVSGLLFKLHTKMDTWTCPLHWRWQDLYSCLLSDVKHLDFIVNWLVNTVFLMQVIMVWLLFSSAWFVKSLFLLEYWCNSSDMMDVKLLVVSLETEESISSLWRSVASVSDNHGCC